MQFRAPNPYQLVVTASHPTDHFGRPVVADLDFNRHRIVIWDQLHGQARLEALRDELELAWSHSLHQGEWAPSLRGRALSDLYFEEDLASQGGAVALEKVVPVISAIEDCVDVGYFFPRP